MRVKNFPRYDWGNEGTNSGEGIVITIWEASNTGGFGIKASTSIKSGQPANYRYWECGEMLTVSLGGGKYLWVTTNEPRFWWNCSEINIPRIPKQTYDTGVAMAVDLMTFGKASGDPLRTCLEGIAARTSIW